MMSSERRAEVLGWAETVRRRLDIEASRDSATLDSRIQRAMLRSPILDNRTRNRVLLMHPDAKVRNAVRLALTPTLRIGPAGTITNIT